MARPSQCPVCWCYEACLEPDNRDCAERPPRMTRTEMDARMAQVVAGYPGSHIEVRPLAQCDLPPDDWSSFVAYWYDGEHEAAALIADGDTPLLAWDALIEYVCNEVL